jgi:Carbohydrate esterase, sialic acid-specific acetylesterase
VTRLLIVFNGESNSGGYAPNSSATAQELAPNSLVKILNNNTLLFEDLHIGVNNLLGHAGLSLGTHGWELGLAIEAIAARGVEVYLVKTGQGGSSISDWNATGSYFLTAAQRINRAKQLVGQSSLAIWYSQGINDAYYNTMSEQAWQQATIAYLNRLRAVVGEGALTLLSELTPQWTTKNSGLRTVSANVSNSAVVSAAGASILPDLNHFDYAGMKLIANRLFQYTLNYIPSNNMPDNLIRVYPGGQSSLSGVAIADAVIDAKLTAITAGAAPNTTTRKIVTTGELNTFMTVPLTLQNGFAGTTVCHVYPDHVFVEFLGVTGTGTAGATITTIPVPVENHYAIQSHILNGAISVADSGAASQVVVATVIGSGYYAFTLKRK